MMTIDQIRKEAPEGATHYDGYSYWKVVNNTEAYFMDCGKWIRYAFTDHEYHIEKGDIYPL